MSERIPWRICKPGIPQVSVGLRKSDPAGWGGDSRVWAVSTLVSLSQVNLRPALEEIPPSGASFWGGCQVVRTLSHSRLCSFLCTVFKHLDYCDSKTMSESLFPGQLQKKNSIKRQSALETGASWKAARFRELFKIRTGWDLDHSRLIFSLPSLNNIYILPWLLILLSTFSSYLIYD